MLSVESCSYPLLLLKPRRKYITSDNHATGMYILSLYIPSTWDPPPKFDYVEFALCKFDQKIFDMRQKLATQPLALSMVNVISEQWAPQPNWPGYLPNWQEPWTQCSWTLELHMRRPIKSPPEWSKLWVPTTQSHKTRTEKAAQQISQNSWRRPLTIIWCWRNILQKSNVKKPPQSDSYTSNLWNLQSP